MKSRIKRNTKNKEQWVIEEKAYTNPCAWETYGVHNKRMAYAQHASYTVSWALLMKESFALTRQSTLHLYILLLLTKVLLLFVMLFFSICVFFQEHSRFRGQQGNREGFILNSSLPLPPNSQTFRRELGDYFRDLTSAHI